MIHRFVQFFKFYRRADTIYNVHSPYIFDFLINVLDTRKKYYAFQDLRSYRMRLMRDENKINIQDYGAGSKTGQKERKIKNIAAQVVSNDVKCRMLFNLVNYIQPTTTLELGTSLGVSTMYMAMASSRNRIYTIEGDQNIYNYANEAFKKYQLDNIESICSKFDDVLPSLVKKLPFIDLAFIDGNHTYEATIRYFDLLASHCESKSVIVLDDLYWSEGMTKAWQEIKQKPNVAFTIDVYDLGFVFFDKGVGLSGDHTLIDYIKKPYRIGLFG